MSEIRLNITVRAHEVLSGDLLVRHVSKRRQWESTTNHTTVLSVSEYGVHTLILLHTKELIEVDSFSLVGVARKANQVIGAAP